MATAVVGLNSDLKRKGWVMEGLVQAASRSFWSPYTGMSKDSIIYQHNDISAKAGHTVIFDYSGNLSGRPVKGKNVATGTGEQKKKFSSKITVERYRYVVDNGDVFDGVDIGDLAINQHSNSRAGLSDLFIRAKDQGIFDAAQGFKGGFAPSHSIQINGATNALAYKDLVNIEKILRTGTGYMTGVAGSTTAAPQRAPLVPYRLNDGRSIWIMVIDPHTAANIRGNAAGNGIMPMAQTADLRGNNNRVFRGLVGQVGQLVLVEAESFFGKTVSNGLDGSETEIAGMRNIDAAGKWSGEEGFTAPRYSRNLIMGAGAIQCAMGKQPDYDFQWSTDFKISSESVLETWMEIQKTRLLAENDEYHQAVRGGNDYGVIALDVRLV